MGIGARDEGHANFEAPRKLLLLRLVESLEQSPPTISAIDVDGTIDITIVEAERFAVELDPIIAFEHLREDRRAVVEVTTGCAKKRYHSAIDRSDSCPEILRHLGNLLR